MKVKGVIKLSELAIGKKAVIQEFTDAEMSLKFLEMGCLPGEEVYIKYIAPFGDPIAVAVAGYTLSMRKKEAATILVK